MSAQPIDLDWKALGACRGEDPDRWFPISGPSPYAKSVCATCPVAEECLDYALTTRQKFGVWGGHDEQERRRILRARRRAAALNVTPLFE